MISTPEPSEGLVMDGYRLIRPLGHGGFGVVWLAFSGASQGYHALKWVSGTQGTLETELSALRHFREISQRLRSPNLIPVEHINLLPGALYYTLPLADGSPGNDPTRADWKPFTLADYIAQANEGGIGLTTEQIIAIFEPVARAAAMLNNEGLVHRDIKPANILFFNSQPCLSDIGLLGRDGDLISVRGTPGYMPPSWYLESNGETDMWGLATTLYTLLTGQNPDKMGKARFRQPIGGFELMSSTEQREWKRLYKVIDKATDENPLERFLSLDGFAEALSGALLVPSPKKNQPSALKQEYKPVPKWAVFATWIFIAILAYLGTVHSKHKSIDINNDIKASTSRLDDRLSRTSENLRSGSASLKEKMEAIERKNAATQGIRPSTNTP